MMIDREQRYRDMAMRGNYRRLYAHLCGLGSREWLASFTEVAAVLGFQLPPTARMHRPWWANQSPRNGHSHALAWTRLDGKPPRTTWKPRRCCSGVGSPNPLETLVSTSYGSSTLPALGRQT